MSLVGKTVEIHPLKIGNKPELGEVLDKVMVREVIRKYNPTAPPKLAEGEVTGITSITAYLVKLENDIIELIHPVKIKRIL